MRATLLIVVVALASGCGKETPPSVPPSKAPEPSRTMPSASGGSPATGGISETSEGLTWTPEQLVAHLKKKGLKFESETGTAIFGPFININLENSQVKVKVMGNPALAQDELALHPNTSFRWGRFVFVGVQPDLGTVQAAFK